MPFSAQDALREAAKTALFTRARVFDADAPLMLEHGGSVHEQHAHSRWLLERCRVRFRDHPQYAARCGSWVAAEKVGPLVHPLIPFPPGSGGRFLRRVRPVRRLQTSARSLLS